MQLKKKTWRQNPIRKQLHTDLTEEKSNQPNTAHLCEFCGVSWQLF